jgi:DHA1 family inner membrane transport protein
VVASNMVAKEKRASAVALMFTGLTASNVLGVPFGTFLGQALGWRATFWTIAAIGVVALVGVALLVPTVRSADAAVPSLRRELGAFRSGQVWLSLGITVLGYGGMFGAFTYIAYTLTSVSGFSSGAVPWLLIVFGVGLFVGNFAGGKLASRSIDGTLLVVLVVLTVVLAVFAAVAASPVLTVIALVLMGAFGFATVPALQTRVMQYADHAPTLASGANIAAFNLGNALGAWIGGLTIAAGLGYTSPIWAGAGITAAAVVLTSVAAAAARRARSRGAVPTGSVATV